MLRLFFIIKFLTLVVLTGSVFSAEKAEQVKGPIVITSEKLSSDNKACTALFEGSVVAKSENMTLYSDKMLVYYAEQTGNVTKIDAEGSVKLIKDGMVVTSKVASYFAGEEKIIFTGEPIAVDKGNIVTGTKITYLMNESRSFVEGSKVLLENKKEK